MKRMKKVFKKIKEMGIKKEVDKLSFLHDEMKEIFAVINSNQE